MRYSAKPIVLLLAAQAVCLALGFWIEDRIRVVGQTYNSSESPNSNNSASPAVSLSNTESSRMASGVAFVWILALQSIAGYLIVSKALSKQSKKLIRAKEESRRGHRDLVRTRDAVIFGLAKLAESRDADTGHHLERISLYSTQLASELRNHPKFREHISTAFLQTIGISSALHDIGKVGTEDAILLKPGKLTADERTRMQSHASIGGECLQQIEQRLANSNFLQMAREIALYHHERWDGTGYPTGLHGEQIPLSARIVSIADVYDALSVKRVYKEAIPHEKCVEMIREQAGRQFDPDLVEVFLRIESQFAAIAKQYAEHSNNGPVAHSEPTQVETSRFASIPDTAIATLRAGESAKREELPTANSAIVSGV